MKSAEEIGAAILETLAAQAARNREAGNVLRAEIRAIMQAHTAGRLTAKRIRALLLREPRPSIRRIQEHMQAITKRDIFGCATQRARQIRGPAAT